MAKSQNGYPANDRSCIVSFDVPGGRLSARRGPVAIFFAWLATEYHQRVEPLVWPGNWGYAERVVRGGTDLSNHASGTAEDFNAPAHPLGVRGTFKGRAATEVRKLADEVAEVCRWGGDYKGRPDEMHWEVVVPEAVLAAWLERRGITSGPAPARAAVAASSPLAGRPCPGITRPGDGMGGQPASDVTRAYQEGLIAAGYLPNTKGSRDGRHGAATAAAIRQLEADRGLTVDAGTGGPQVWQALGGAR